MTEEKWTVNEAIKNWPTISKVVSTIRSEKQYHRVIKLLDRLIDEVSIKGDRTKESLIDTLGTLIKDYEDRNFKEPDSDPIDVLLYLIKEHQLKQTDLKEIGSQGVVSEILNRKKGTQPQANNGIKQEVFRITGSFYRSELAVYKILLDLLNLIDSLS